MTDRRQFIQGGVTLSMAAGAGVPSAAMAKAPGPIRLAGFVYDRRFAEARELAARAGRRGAKLWAISGDLFDLWSERLEPAWRETPAAIAGITTAADLFVLEDLAADRRMKVVYRGEHGAPAGGTVTHSLAGPDAMFAQAALTENPDLWAPLLGAAMVGCPAGSWRPTTLALASPARTARDEPLHSWVIAPRAPPQAA